MSQDEFDQTQGAAVSHLPLPGGLVRQAREQRGLSLRELSEKTRLTENVLQAVENDDFQAMGEPVYARGYYRKCADALGLNSQALVEAYEQHSGTASPVPTIDQRPSIAYREGPGRLALGIALGLMLLVFLSCALWLWNEERDAPLVPLALGDDHSEPIAAKRLPLATANLAANVKQQDEPAKGLEVAAASETPQPVALSKPVAAAAAQQAQVQAIPAPTQRPQVQQVAAASSVELGVEISGGEAWVDIRDREGRKLLYKLLNADSVRQVQGKTPLRVSLGRADHVKLMLNNRKIDFSDFLAPGLTARFFLDASGRLYPIEAGAAQ